MLPPVVGGGGGDVAGGVVGGGDATGGAGVGVGAAGPEFAGGWLVGAGDPLAGALPVEGVPAGRAPDVGNAATVPAGAVAPSGFGGAPAAGAVPGVAVIAAAPVGVTDPDGFVAAASCGPLAAAVLAGAPDASNATMAKVAVVLSPVASTRLAAAGRARLAIESPTVAVRLTSLLDRFAQAVVTPSAVVGSGTRGRRRWFRRR